MSRDGSEPQQRREAASIAVDLLVERLGPDLTRFAELFEEAGSFRFRMVLMKWREAQTPAAETIDERRARDAGRARRARAAAGATPRDQSLSVTRPWEVEGVSRRTWERRQRVS